MVTGGGGGIGAAIADELGRQGAFVVTMDPLVSLDGSASLPAAASEATTAELIVAAGGSARASAVSVTDGPGVRALFAELVTEFGRLDAVINVAGISRPTSFASGTDEDWRSVLSVHLDGYRNILEAALPLMAAAGYGRILGVTSGSGWRAADTGAYGCAKRAVAALTWQLGRDAPAGVVVNATSPIAVTRMVTEALKRAPAPAPGSSATGGLSLGSMPEPEALGPIGAHLVGDGFSWCSGQVIFTAGSEVAVVERPRLLEVVRADAAAVVLGALVAAEATQRSGGGSNPRFPDAPDGAVSGVILPESPRKLHQFVCAIVSDRPALAAAITTAIEDRGAACVVVSPREYVLPQVDAVVVALAGPTSASGAASEWERMLAEHAGIVDQIHADARWARAVADYAAAADRPVRMVTLTDAVTSGGRSRGQAAAQLARAARKATKDRVTAIAVSVEAGDAPVAEFAAQLLCGDDAAALSGAELVAGSGWVGLRSHPRPSASIVLGGTTIPSWFDDVLRSVVG